MMNGRAESSKRRRPIPAAFTLRLSVIVLTVLKAIKEEKMKIGHGGNGTATKIEIESNESNET